MHRFHALALTAIFAASWLFAQSPDGPAIRDSDEITAKDRAFWSFQPLRPVVVPAVRSDQRGRNPIDAFLLQKLAAKRLIFAAVADP